MPSSPKVVDFNPPFPEEAVAVAAAAWVVARDRGLEPKEMTALAKWLAADPRHAAEFERISSDWKGLDRLKAIPELVILSDKIAMRPGTPLRWNRTRRLAIAAAAAAAAVSATLWLARDFWSQGHPIPDSAAKSYVVLASTARRLALPDGSVAELNGDSQIALDFVPAERRVRLVRGEAHFIVAKNALRPFIVSAGSITVRAVGTAFNVRLASGVVEVLVTEGKVNVSEVRAGNCDSSSTTDGTTAKSLGPPLLMNERAVVHLNPGGAATVVVDRPASADFEEAMAWKSTRIVFDHTPLDQVVGAFNRYNRHQLVLADPELRSRTLTGVFRTDNLAGFTRLLPASVDVTAEAVGENRTLLRAGP